MQALVLKQPGTLTLESVPEPAPGPGDVLLRVKRVGLCGSDLNSYRGKNPLVQFPRILGHEVAATLINDTPGRPDLAAGTHVTLSPYIPCGHCASCRRNRPNACRFNQTLGVQRDGALVEYLTQPPDNLFPAQLSLEELCLVEPLTVGFHAAARGRITAADTVAVIGCGGAGLGSIAASRSLGARTIAIDVSEDKLELARKAGATELVNTTRESMHHRLFAITQGRGPDVIIEALGLPETFRAAVEEVAFTGRVVYIGYAKDPVSYDARLFVQKELDILGSRNALPEDFRAVIRMLELRHFPVKEAISAIVTLDEAPHSIAAWSGNPSRFSKIMVRLD